MGPASLARARQTFDAELPGIIETAERHGVRLGVEPMHPLRIFAKGTLNTLAQTAALCARHPKLGVVLDLFHTWWDPDLDAVLPSLVPRLTLVQICGVAQSAEDPLPKRSLPSEGVVDLDHILRLLARSGYRGKFEFELFAQDLDEREPRDIMKRAVADFAAASHQSSSR
jgi:sugar phosphate isomerase/epimerase